MTIPFVHRIVMDGAVPDHRTLGTRWRYLGDAVVRAAVGPALVVR